MTSSPFRNLNRLEFLVTLACTGRCRHCSEGDHTSAGQSLDKTAAVRAVHSLCREYKIESVMTFGGEPLLCLDCVCAIHEAAREMGIPKRQLITNGFFSRDTAKIIAAAKRVADSGVNDILLSVDAFHQETIPLEPVMTFALAVKETGSGMRTRIPVRIRSHPAWLVSADHDNPYNVRTREILAEFEKRGIEPSDGNIVFPSGNAKKYLSEYFDPNDNPTSPYAEDPNDIHSVCIGPSGDLFGGNISERDICDILSDYAQNKA